MYAHTLVILITGTPNYHHCLLSSNLGKILLGRKECDITYTYTYWIILISTLIPTPNVPVFNFNIKVVSDHHAKIIQLSKVILMHNTCVPIHTKINILEICWVSKETFVAVKPDPIEQQNIKRRCTVALVPRTCPKH